MQELMDRMQKSGGLVAGSPMVGNNPWLPNAGVQYLSSTAGSQVYSANALVAR